jgi:hypothetical protein
VKFLFTKTNVSVMFIVLCFQNNWGQNLENINKGHPLKVSGGLSMNQIFYNAIGSGSSRSPYTYYLAGNLNFSLFGWSVPFSYTYSNQQSSFQQPFNQYGLHPTYKWITAHIGYASMNFSSYTLSSHQFLGTGIELSPGSKFKFSAMYGRLQKAVEYDTSNTNIQPAYQRIGYGLKGGVNLGKASVELMAFHSKDRLSSLEHNIDSLEIYPEENLAFGINTAISFFEKLNMQAEYGSSLVTRDTRSDVLSRNILFTKRTSTEKYTAVKAGIKYSQTFYSAGITYERIDPGYRTHGAYYFNNDLENISTNVTASLFKKKLSLAANVGIQHDDLDNTKVSSLLRVANSYSIGFVPVSQLNISATYSNYKSHTNIKSQFESINQLTSYDSSDTLDYTQISENTSLNVNYTLSGTENYRQNLNFNGVYQKASEYQEQVETNSGARFLSMNIAHSLAFIKTNTSLSTSVCCSNSKTSSINTYTVGPTVSIRRNFFKNRLKGSFSTSYNNSYSNGELTNTVLNFRINTGYTWQKRHNFTLTGANINRMAKSSDEKKKYNEYTVTLGYTCNF